MYFAFHAFVQQRYLSITCLLLIFPNFFLFFSYVYADFPYFVEIVTTRRGHLRVYHEGYSYGMNQYNQKRHPNQTRQRWRCTRGSGQNTKRCSGSIETDTIDGYTMMRLRNKHNC